MTNEEKKVLTDIVSLIQTLMVKTDALEGALIRRGVILGTDRTAIADEYLRAALDDLAGVRMSIASLPTTESVKG